MALLFISTLKKKPALHWIFIWLGKPCKTLGTCSATCQLLQRNNDLRRGEREMWKIVSVLKHILWEQVQAKKAKWRREKSSAAPSTGKRSSPPPGNLFTMPWGKLIMPKEGGKREWKNELKLIHFKNATLCHVMDCGLYWWHICTSRDRNSSISESSSVLDSIKK